MKKLLIILAMSSATMTAAHADDGFDRCMAAAQGTDDAFHSFVFGICSKKYAKESQSTEDRPSHEGKDEYTTSDYVICLQDAEAQLRHAPAYVDYDKAIARARKRCGKLHPAE
jgi:hypothetical protein